MANKSLIKKIDIFLLVINILLAICTLISYLGMYISPSQFWQAGFISLSIPVTLTLNHIFLIYWALRKKWYKISISLVTLIIVFPLFSRTLSIHSIDKQVDSTQNFRILDYNASSFGKYNMDSIPLQTKEIINWLADFPADIKCFQEFYHNDTKANLNTIRLMEKKGYHYYMFSDSTLIKSDRGAFGVVTFSKFPIIHTGEISFQGHKYNRCIYTDLVINKDTVRLFNFHMESMNIQANNLVMKEVIGYKEIYWRLKNGFIKRGDQALLVEEEIKKSPYPVIVCGDMNDTPYSFAYQRIRKHLNNAFEEKGNGFGFSYNGKLFFLRIDNQFFDENKFTIHSFKTHREIKNFDHFPISATYSLKK